VRQYLLRDQRFEPRILGFKLLQPPQVRHIQAAVELPPAVEGWREPFEPDYQARELLIALLFAIDC
jgi:hypothetical protein